MRVAADMVVTVSYQLFDGAGKLADDTSDPVEYLHAHAQIIPALERGLEGATMGDQRSITALPDEAFGERDEAAVLEIDRADFPNAEMVQAGDELTSELPDGTEVPLRVIEVRGGVLLVDLNHPLAGQTVRFEAKVLNIRPATDDELDEALREVDERIVYETAIVYGSDSQNRLRSTPDEASGDGLVQLRTTKSDAKNKA